MSENKPPETSVSKLVLEMAQQKAPPDFMDELKKRLKVWFKKWSMRLSGIGVLLGSNWMSWHIAKGEDLSWLTTFAGWGAVAVLVFIVLNKLK